MSVIFLGCPEFSWGVRNFLEVSGIFLGCPEFSWGVRNFLGCPEFSWGVRNFLWGVRNFLGVSGIVHVAGLEKLGLERDSMLRVGKSSRCVSFTVFHRLS